MDQVNKLPKRKPIRLKDRDYGLPGSYFITLCTAHRDNLFWSHYAAPQDFSWTPVGANCVRPKNLPLSAAGKLIANELEKWHTQYERVKLPQYVIMPNHIHIIVTILPEEDGRTQFAPTVSRMVKQFKGAVTKQLGKPLWQKSFYDHIIRDKQDYETRTQYIYQNPFRWLQDELYPGT